MVIMNIYINIKGTKNTHREQLGKIFLGNRLSPVTHNYCEYSSERREKDKNTNWIYKINNGYTFPVNMEILATSYTLAMLYYSKNPE